MLETPVMTRLMKNPSRPTRSLVFYFLTVFTINSKRQLAINIPDLTLLTVHRLNRLSEVLGDPVSGIAKIQIFQINHHPEADIFDCDIF